MPASFSPSGHPWAAATAAARAAWMLVSQVTRWLSRWLCRWFVHFFNSKAVALGGFSQPSRSWFSRAAAPVMAASWAAAGSGNGKVPKQVVGQLSN